MTARARIVAALAIAGALVGVTACYSPPTGDDDRCKITCLQDCPDDLTCSGGFCVAPGDSCVPPAPTYVEVEAGARHACALTDGGLILCWGDNSVGQLGIGTAAQAAAPTVVGDPTMPWTALAVGGDHTCALRGGVPYCWGDNHDGQVQGGSGGLSRTPTAVTLGPGAPAFDQLSAGTYHTCALGNGSAWCWGGPDQVGIGSAVSVATYVPPPATEPDATWTAIAAGAEHTCAISSDGGLACWGDNASGQTGQAASETAQPPMEVSRLPATYTALAVSAGDTATCAVISTTGDPAMGALYCWGEDTNGMIGDNAASVNTVLPPTQIGSDMDWTSVAVSNDAICGVQGGTASCWGYAESGGLGDGYWREVNAVLPSMARTLGSADAIVLDRAAPEDVADDGRDEIGCLLTGGAVQCWGDNRDGAIGTGVAAMSATGVLVAPPAGLTWSSVTAGSAHTCAQASDGTLWCWGANYEGQVDAGVGRGVTQPCVAATPCDYALPVAAPVTVGSAARPDGIIVGDEFSCALQAGEIWCWGNDQQGVLGVADPNGFVAQQVLVPAGTGTTWTAITGGPEATCATTDSGQLLCWGYVNGTSIDTPSAPPGTALTDSAAMSMGAFSCGLVGENRICYGDDTQGVFGDGNNGDVITPKLIEANVAQLSIGGQHACEIMAGSAAGQLSCYGLSSYGEAGSATSPYYVTNGQPIMATSGAALAGCTDVSVGEQTSCALCTAGGSAATPFCWGRNDVDQLGVSAASTVASAIALPVGVPTGKAWSSISAGTHHACAVTTDHALYCWGYGSFGQLGDGGQSFNLPTTIAAP